MTAAERVRDFVLKNFYVRGDDLDDATSLVGSGIVDSTGILEIISFLEQEFAITVEDGETVPENLENIARIAEFVDRKRGARSS